MLLEGMLWARTGSNSAPQYRSTMPDRSRCFRFCAAQLLPSRATMLRSFTGCSIRLTPCGGRTPAVKAFPGSLRSRPPSLLPTLAKSGVCIGGWEHCSDAQSATCAFFAGLQLSAWRSTGMRLWALTASRLPRAASRAVWEVLYPEEAIVMRYRSSRGGLRWIRSGCTIF